MVKSNDTLVNKEDTSKETNFELLSKGTTLVSAEVDQWLHYRKVYEFWQFHRICQG